MTASGDDDHVARSRELLARIRQQLASEGHDASSPLGVAVEELSESLDELEKQWTLRDVSELRERDAFRDEIERHLEAVVWLHELEPLRMLHVSPTYEVVWGRPISTLYENPRDWLDHIHVEDRPRVEAAYARMLDGEAFDAEYRIVRPDGQVRWIHDRGRPFSVGPGSRDRVAGIAEDVTERKEAEAALRRAERRRRAAALSAERAEARERRALASDLHDSVSQSLALARTKLAALCDDPEAAGRSERLREIESLIAEADERTRTLTFRLSPPILHDLGLAAAAEWLAEDLQRRFGLRVSVTDAGLPASLPFEVREALFRSLRELLINVARHAQTDEARVRLAREADRLMLTVEDGGIGFDVGREGSAGFGLVSIRERLEALGGELEIDSERGRGTRARMIAPARWDE